MMQRRPQLDAFLAPLLFVLIASLAASALAQRGKSPEDVARAMKDSRKTAQEVAAVLKKEHRLGSAESTTILKGVGYRSTEVAGALKAVYRADGAGAARDMSRARFSPTEIGSGLKSAYRAPASDTATYLRAAKIGADDVGKALKSSYRSASAETAKALDAAGFEAIPIGGAIKSAYRASLADMVDTLKTIDLTPREIGTVLSRFYSDPVTQRANVLKSGGSSAQETLETLIEEFDVEIEDGVGAERTVGYSPTEIAVALHALGVGSLDGAQMFASLGGDDKEAVAVIIVINTLEVSDPQQRSALIAIDTRELGMPVEILFPDVCRTPAPPAPPIPIPYPNISSGLVTAGYDVSDTATAMLEGAPGITEAEVIAAFLDGVYDNDPQNLGDMQEVLGAVQAPAATVANAMKDADATAGAAIEMMAEQYTAGETMVALLGAQYDPQETAEATHEHRQEATVQQMAAWMGDAGATAEQIGDMIYNVFDVTEADEIAEILLPVVTAISVVIAIIVTVVTAGAGAGVAVAAATSAATLAVLVAASSVPTVMGALDEETTLTKAEIVQAFRDAGTSAADVAEGINDGLGRGAESAADYMKDAGFSCSSVTGILDDEYDKNASDTLTILFEVGFGYNAIVDAVVDVYDMTATQVGALIAQLGLN